MAVQLVGRPDAFHDAAGETFGILGTLHAALDHRELVAAQTRDGIDLADAGIEPVRDRAQQFIADQMPERVVDLLEIVEVEAEHRKAESAADLRDRLLDPLAEQACGSAISSARRAGP